MKQVDRVSKLKLLEIINRLDFFRQFSLEERRVLLEDRLEVYFCKKNFRVFREGEIDATFYLVLSGKINIVQTQKNRILGTVSAGEFLGEGAFITQGPRSASAVAYEDALLLRLDITALRSLSSAIREKLKDAIIAGMAQRIVELNERVQALV
ncbi:Crp/Fnr family transcriptional regulator [Aliidiomarina quisquiliarum]|uniref:Crp/Fnr family transcriptional regulator n=1 Tax=Aliidiomarina quisquiliarum TaxID=2938947 RepID=UPI00208E8B2D|nr:cyclic nucleotide-binding domain-containing protein [Aliidiomarina quisquiliarum]MCO4322650.1 cyclic nucleotide-binding domain-containing protein [Aliidiomarina quisquiliarum]